MYRVRTETQNKVFNLLDLPNGLTLQDWVNASGLTFEQLNSKTRVDNLMVWRQLIMAYFHGVGETITSASKIFGKDHSTGIHACKCVINSIQYNDQRIISRIKALKDYKGISDSDNKLASKIMSDHYTRFTNKILDYETKKVFLWIEDAINEALSIKNELPN